MEKKVFGIWVLGIVCFTFLGLATLWFAPFQDSEVSGTVSGKVLVGNITIPLGDLLNYIKSDSNTPDLRSSLPMVYDVGDYNVSDGVGDLVLGKIVLEGDLHVSGKNLDKLVRGILFSQLSQIYVIGLSDDQFIFGLGVLGFMIFVAYCSDFYFKHKRIVE